MVPRRSRNRHTTLQTAFQKTKVSGCGGGICSHRGSVFRHNGESRRNRFAPLPRFPQGGTGRGGRKYLGRVTQGGTRSSLALGYYQVIPPGFPTIPIRNRRLDRRFYIGDFKGLGLRERVRLRSVMASSVRIWRGRRRRWAGDPTRGTAGSGNTKAEKFEAEKWEAERPRDYRTTDHGSEWVSR